MTRVTDNTVVKLNATDWIKILLLALMHAVILLGVFWKVHLDYEHRITALETNQVRLVKVMDAVIGVKKP